MKLPKLATFQRINPAPIRQLMFSLHQDDGSCLCQCQRVRQSTVAFVKRKERKRNADRGNGGIKQHQVRGDGHSEHVSDNPCISTVPSHWKKINLTFLGQRKLKTNGGRWLPRSKQWAKALHHLFIPCFLSKRKGQAIFFFFLPHRRRPDGFMC